jgi:hypothetical protein
MKTCRHCEKPFEPVRSLQFVCSPECAFAYSRLQADMKPYKPRKLKPVGRSGVTPETPSEAATKAQKAFNKWVRLRDEGKPCISCGYPDNGTRLRHASHYRPAGSNPALRFEPDNVHASCSICNKWKSGNLTGYRLGLVHRVGIERVEWLEGPHDLPHRTVEEIRAINKHYANLARCLERERAA